MILSSLLLVLLFLGESNAMADDTKEIAEFCMEASDFVGCVRSTQELPILPALPFPAASSTAGAPIAIEVIPFFDPSTKPQKLIPPKKVRSYQRSRRFKGKPWERQRFIYNIPNE